MMAEKNAESVDALVREIRILRYENNEHIIQIETGDEFEEIATQINKMVKSINDLNTRNTDLIKLNSMIEMRNLQMQINPHFIYNTLDNIKYLILEEPKKAMYLLERFTHILRYSINNTKADVALAEIWSISKIISLSRKQDLASVSRFGWKSPRVWPLYNPKTFVATFD